MGRLYFAAIMAAVLLPVMLAGFLMDATRRGVFALLLVAALFAGYFVFNSSDTLQAIYWTWTMPTYPPDETAFTAVADELRVLRVKRPSDADYEAALRQVEARVCALPGEANNWVGQVQQRYLISSGDGASLAIGISPHLVVRTAFFPDKTGTLIRAGTPLFAPANELEQGDVVRFSGTLVGHAGACPGDPPAEPNEKLRDPEFLLRFTQVAKTADH